MGSILGTWEFSDHSWSTHQWTLLIVDMILIIEIFKNVMNYWITITMAIVMTSIIKISHIYLMVSDDPILGIWNPSQFMSISRCPMNVVVLNTMQCIMIPWRIQLMSSILNSSLRPFWLQLHSHAGYGIFIHITHQLYANS